MKKLICLLLLIAFFSCERKTVNAPETIQKINRIYRKYSDFSNFTPITYSEFVYDNAGKLLKEKVRGYWGDVDYKYNYLSDRLDNVSIEDPLNNKTTGILYKLKYDAKNRLIQLSDENETTIETFEYTADSNLPNKRTITILSELRKYSEYTVQNGNIVEERVFDKSKELLHIISFIYDTKTNYQDDISPIYYISRLDGPAIYFSKNNIIERKVELKKENPPRKSVVKTQLILNEKGQIYRIAEDDLIPNSSGLYYEIEYTSILKH